MIDLSKLTALAGKVAERSTTAQHREPGKQWYRVENAAGTDVTEVFIYDMIGAWGVTAQDFVADLDRVRTPNITLRLASPGGEVFDGLAIYAALLRHPANVTTHVDSLAASAASFIALAGEHVVIERTARMMIHDASGLCLGNTTDMREMADLLDDLSDNIASIYADRAGGKREEWRNLMRAETWFTAERAVEAGLAHEIAGQEPDNRAPARVSNSFAWDAAAFRQAVMEGIKG